MNKFKSMIAVGFTVAGLLGAAALPSFADNQTSGNGARGEVGDNPNATALFAPSLNGNTDCVRDTGIGATYAVCPAEVGTVAATHSLSDPVTSNSQQSDTTRD